MPNAIEMLVGLKIPDTTAITALRALHKMGLKGIKSAARENYYKFHIEADEAKFKNDISKADIIVNANKNYFKFGIEKSDRISVLVKDMGEGSGLLKLLQERLGFKNIKKMENGIWWTLEIEGSRKEIAKKAAEGLLHNGNYQEYSII
ncbi:hypothetical protein HYT54_02420 [Candidatus Woesearchaeota archaeon]|nr:hypothetical protein [Candidatus Woesearchaeota archaeon]